MTDFAIGEDFLEAQNAAARVPLEEDYAALARTLGRRGVDSEALVGKIMAFGVAIPTWGVGAGGTRFARFPGAGEPRHLFDKLDDCATIQKLVRATPTVSPHFPWDSTEDYAALREAAAGRGLAFDAVNSNTFQDQPKQKLSYTFGSLSHVDAAVRAQAIAHNIDCIAIGRKLGAKALTVWIGDGSNFAGQSNLDGRRSIVISTPCGKLYMGRCRATWRLCSWNISSMNLAFYSLDTVISDWGTSFAAAVNSAPRRNVSSISAITRPM